MKKIKIMSTFVIFLILISTILLPVNAENKTDKIYIWLNDRQYIDVGFEIPDQFSFSELYIDEWDLWSHVVANSIEDVESNGYLFGFEYEILERVFFVVDLFEDIEGVDTKFYLKYEDGTPVLSGDVVNAGATYYAEISACNNHNFREIEGNEECCYFKQCKVCSYLDYEIHDNEDLGLRPFESHDIPRIVYGMCTNVDCNYVYEYELEGSTGSHRYLTKMESVNPTCSEPGYEKYICQECGYIIYEPLQPLGCQYTQVTCTEDSKCTICGDIRKSALGHDLRHGSWGKCMRDGCDYRLIDVQGALNSAGTNISNWWQGDVSEPVNNGIENVKDWLSEKKEEASDIGENIKQGFNTVLLIIFGIFIIVVFVTILPLVIKFFDFLSDRKNKRGDKK